jgi:hypothetical protein
MVITTTTTWVEGKHRKARAAAPDDCGGDLHLCRVHSIEEKRHNLGHKHVSYPMVKKWNQKPATL